MAHTLDEKGAILVKFSAGAGALIAGAGANTQVAYFTATNVIAGDAGFTYDPATDTATLSGGFVMNGGASSVITVNDNVANAMTIVDAGGIEYLRLITTNTQPVVVWNEGGADVDHRWEASGVTNALFIQGSDGAITVAGPSIAVANDAWIGIGAALERIVFSAGGDICVMGARFGVGTLVPTSSLEVVGNIEIAEDNFLYLNSGAPDTKWSFGKDSNHHINVRGGGASTRAFRVLDSDNADQVVFSVEFIDGDTYIRGNLGAGTAGPDRLFHAEVSDAVTNAVTYAQRLSHISSDTVVAGFGTGIEFELEENDGSNRVAAYITVDWEDAGEGASADGRLNFGVMTADAAAATAMSIWNGKVGIGIAAGIAGKTHIDQSIDDAAIPVLILDQADLSEEFINYLCASTGAGDPVDTATGVGGAYARLRVAVNGTFKYIQLYNA